MNKEKDFIKNKTPFFRLILAVHSTDSYTNNMTCSVKKQMKIHAMLAFVRIRNILEQSVCEEDDE